MFSDQIKKLRQKVGEGKEGNNKKKIENLVFFIILLIITIVVINVIWKDKKPTNQTETNTTGKQLAVTKKTENNTIQTNEEDLGLTMKLEEILDKMQGVGDVKVFVNYSESSEVVPMYNENEKSSTTEETDTSGGIRKVQQTDSQKDIIYQENSGIKTPMTKKVMEPKIEGAIITAKGANDAEIKTNIIQAVEAVTGLATHKIQVFEMK